MDNNFELLFQHAHIGVVIADNKGKMLRANPFFCRLTGYPENVLQAMKMSELCREPDDCKQRADDEVEIRFLKQNGDELFLAFNYRTVSNERGNFRLYMVRDCTEEKKSEQMQRLFKEKESLLREIQHRIGNHLGILNALIDLDIHEPDTAMDVNDVLNRIKVRINTIRLLYKKACHGNSFARIALPGYFRELIQMLQLNYGWEKQKISVHSCIEDMQLAIDVVKLIGLVCVELIIYALRHTKAEGQIELSFKKENYLLEICYSHAPGAAEEVGGLKLVSLLSEQFGGQLSIGLLRNGKTRVALAFESLVKA